MHCWGRQFQWLCFLSWAFYVSRSPQLPCYLQLHSFLWIYSNVWLDLSNTIYCYFPNPKVYPVIFLLRSLAGKLRLTTLSSAPSGWWLSRPTAQRSHCSFLHGFLPLHPSNFSMRAVFLCSEEASPLLPGGHTPGGIWKYSLSGSRSSASLDMESGAQPQSLCEPMLAQASSLPSGLPASRHSPSLPA